ncbi:hypothetical protein SCHPADRAFT_923511 [Schizopora paradoxa]|uniref:Uncharacterized protein n=1 Tax=Schizopora paradoxa TaxID=27342 RepID=A0A0H2S8Q2_9AGAM|nr:hypothetical protein SCHPADRAFT_923511 [Schizopora paradoxa]
MMGFAFGGLAVLSVPRHAGLWTSLIEIRSMFLALVFSFVVIVLAYMTNPSETSFRAFLTEQSFRHHLTKLDDAQDDHQIDHRKHGLLDASPEKHGLLDTSPFQFADRASVSLRTPKHFFRSFGVLSIAAVLPSGNGARGRLDGTNPSIINNSWFIGAFGMWWWAANLDSFWRGVGIVGPKEEDGASISGILDMKALDRVHDRHVLPNSHQVQSPSNGKQRSRERFNQQRHNSGNVITNRRSSTPPPLPRSASLPLHAKRTAVPPSNPPSPEHSRNHGTHTVTHHSRQQHQSQAHLPMPTAGGNEPSSTTTTNGTVAQPANNNCPILSSSPSSKSPAVAFAESPQIAEILHKVDSAQASVNELQDQFTSATQSSANAATRLLQEELEQQRARKQADDAARTELRTRTRALEDSKRHAESSKREVEKRLKSAQSTAATSERRTSTLTAETTTLRAAAKEHAERAERSKIEADSICTELKEDVEGRKSEVKDVEDILTALVRRVKELEAKVAEEEERLRRACEDAEIRKRVEPAEEILSASAALPEAPAWPIKSPLDVLPRVTPLTPALANGVNGLGSPARFDSPTETSAVGYFSRPSVLPRRSETVPTSSFAPFSPLSEQREDNPISPLSSSFIPSGLIESLGIHSTAPALYTSAIPHSPLSSGQHEQCASPMSRSFQSDDDVILERRGSAPYIGYGLAPGSGAPSAFAPTPASLSPASPLRSIPDERSELNGSDIGTQLETSLVLQEQGITSSKRPGWFTRDRKGHSASVGGLNPDAKEFSLPKDRARTLSFLHSKQRPAAVNAVTPDGFTNGTSPSFDSKTHTPDSSGSSSSFTPSFEDSASSLSSFSSPAASIRSTTSSGLPNASSNKFLGLSGVSGLGTAWLGTTQSAFAPTPTEREALARALTGGSNSKNASMDQLPMFLTSTSTSPQTPPALPSVVGYKTLRSPGLISRPAWLESLRNGKGGASNSSSFSPFDDEKSNA